METRPWLDRERDIVFHIPVGWAPLNAAACRECRQLVAWCQPPEGKRVAVNTAGTSHFDTCVAVFRERVPQEPDDLPPMFSNIDMDR